MKTKIKPGISTIIVVHNEDAIIEETLKSVKGIVDEIIVVHDGPCKDNTVKIAKKYTKKVYVTPHKGRSAFNFITGLKKTQYDWILKIDADEPLSEDLRKNIRSLSKRYPKVDGFSFIHPLWNGKEAYTTYWPRKTSLVRRSKISYIAFPGWDASIPIKGTVKKTNYVLLHKPLKNQDIGWAGFKEKVLKRYAPNSAKYLLMDFKEFETYNYDRTDFPLRIKVRRHLPLLTNFLYGILVFFRQLLKEGAWREGTKGVDTLFKTFIYNTYLGWLIMKEKANQKKEKRAAQKA